jgi:hypothetical protein
MARFSLSRRTVSARTKDVALMILIGYNLSNRTGFAAGIMVRVYQGNPSEAAGICAMHGVSRLDCKAC